MLEVAGVSVTIGGASILSAVDLEVSPGEVVVVLGPSGSGKSTMLRSIAGLQAIGGGEMTWEGQTLDGVPPHRRGFGLMFQDLALFPHRTVAGNIAFGLEMTGEPGIGAAVDQALDLVSLSGMGDRPIDTLSGGEQQRVALARALAPRPRLLMFDEPLGSLDRVLRQQLTAELRSIFDGLDTAVLYVTHDQEEALAMADRIIILSRGRVVQAGAPEDVWRSPATEFVADFIGWDTFADAESTAGVVTTPWGPVPTAVPDGPARVGLAPGAAEIDPNGPLRGVVQSAKFTGSGYSISIDPADGPAIVVDSSTALAAGTPVRWTADLSAVVVFR